MGVERQPITGDQLYLFKELAPVRPGAGGEGGSGVATLSSAGHPPPLAIGPGSNPLRIKLEAGLPLGLFQESVYTDIAWTFEPTGGGLLLYTDGVSEAFNHHGEQFGDRRMSEILAAEAISTVSSTVAAIRRGVESFSASEVAADDMTILACIRTPSPP